MSKLLSKNKAIALLSILVVVQFILLGLFWHAQHNTNKINNGELNSLQQDAVSASNGLSYQPLAVSPTDNKIYLPQLNLSIPLSVLGSSLVYSPDVAYTRGASTSNVPDEASISTYTTASSAQSQTQFDCSELVRIKFEAKSDPYNPSEMPSGSVTLANGKILQIYSNHLSNCQTEWAYTKASPDAIAALFRQAQSY